jgi:hypothetical protein
MICLYLSGELAMVEAVFKATVIRGHIFLHATSEMVSDESLKSNKMF